MLWWNFFFKHLCSASSASEGVDFFGDMSPIRGRGLTPLPLKKWEKMRKILSMPWKTFFIETIFLYCHPCQNNTQYALKNFFYWNHFSILSPMLRGGGGGQSLGNMSIKIRVFYWCTPLPNNLSAEWLLVFILSCLFNCFRRLLKKNIEDDREAANKKPFT